jgi:thiosulfate reductase cytochrome b subunit
MSIPIEARDTTFAPDTTAAAARPLWVRLSHWLIAFAVIIMMFSGWAIYNASPIFPAFTFPAQLTLGGWLGGALQWHFAAMWLIFCCGITYLLLNFVTLRMFRQFFPLSAKTFARDLGAALHGKLAHDASGAYNAVQKAAYLAVCVALIVVVLSGLAIWKPVQLALLRELMGGYDTARVVHFCAMAFIAAFFIVHIVMVALVPRSLIAMVTTPRKQK